MPQLSLSVRSEFAEQFTEMEPIVLCELTVPGSSEVHRLSSHPTRRLSVDPLRYGTICGSVEYPWVMMAMAWPDDQDGSPPATSLVFDNVVDDMADIARSVAPGQQIDVVLKLVFTTDCDAVEQSYVMKATGASYNAQQVSLKLSREPIELEPDPAFRMTPQRCPGLFR